MLARIVTALLAAFAIAGCASKAEVVSYDFANKAGLYILAYAPDEALRRAIEDQLVADLTARDMVGFASYKDLPVLSEATRVELLSAANVNQALGVLVVNQVAPGEDGIIDSPARISPEHPDLAAFYEYTRAVQQNYRPGSEVFAEANAFLLQGDSARLVWSGTTWSFEADGQGGAIGGMSDNIANELGQIRDALRPGD